MCHIKIFRKFITQITHTQTSHSEKNGLEPQTPRPEIWCSTN
ncbi:hypothetical protein pb186bvf_018731 [Paramecium bursaria]